MARSSWTVALVLVLTLTSGSRAADLFVDSGQRLGSEVTWGVALGDIDGDTDLDAVTANFDAGAIVWLNDGKGQFSDSGQRLGTGHCEMVALADFDGDGALDVLLGSWDSTLSIWWNDGAGALTQGRSPSIFSKCLSMGVADLNADARPDIFVGSAGRDFVLLNRGDRTFADGAAGLGRTETGGIAFGDLDGDGDPDVVTAGWNEPGAVWANDGAGALTPRSSFDAAALHVHGAALADLEGDGDLDAFFAIAGGPAGYNVWRNDGAGMLELAGFDLGSEPQQGLAVADFNLDGRPDVALAIGIGGTPAPSRVWLGTDDGFVDSGVRMGMAFAARIAAGDLDADGDDDLFIAFLSLPEAGWDYKPAPNEVWLNTTNEKTCVPPPPD
jgi:hypothetical protein